MGLEALYLINDDDDAGVNDPFSCGVIVYDDYEQFSGVCTGRAGQLGLVG